MKRAIVIICIALLAVGGISILAQKKSYPKDIFGYELENRVTFKGNSPRISDFVTTFFKGEEMIEIWGTAKDAWNHHLRNEPQEYCAQIFVDEKNGYMRFFRDWKECDEEIDDKSTIEMCYWNCADGNHKLFAVNCFSMSHDKYYIGQFSGINFYLYDNATHKLWAVNNEDIGAAVEVENTGYEYDGNVYHVLDPKTGQTKTLTSEEMDEWLEQSPVLVYRLPQQGKDIIVEIHRGTEVSEVTLKWDGMYFKQ